MIKISCVNSNSLFNVINWEFSAIFSDAGDALSEAFILSLLLDFSYGRLAHINYSAIWHGLER